MVGILGDSPKPKKAVVWVVACESSQQVGRKGTSTTDNCWAALKSKPSSPLMAPKGDHRLRIGISSKDYCNSIP